MRKRSPFFLAVFAFSLSGAARAEDDPRALIERALKALGGEEKLSQKVATQRKVKGILYAPGLAEQGIPVAGELHTQSGNRSRFTFQVEVLGNKIEAVQVTNGDKAWRGIKDQVEELKGEELDSMRKSLHQDRVVSLIPLLKDKGFTLTSLGESKVEDRPVQGIKVSYKGQPETMLYFDKETGLVVKYAYRAKRFGDEKESLQESILSDYRELDPAAGDERTLKAAKVHTDGPGLLEFLRMQTPDPARVDKVKALVRKLGDDKFEVREKAAADLVALGEVAVPFLREATKDQELEVARRAQDCLDKIGERKSESVQGAVVRLLALRKPAGTAEALLNLLPHADEATAREIRSALYALAQRDGKPDPVLEKALEDKDPVRRAAAAAVLGKDGGAYLKQPGRRLYISGIKQSFKVTSYSDGKIIMSLEIEDVQFFNQFDDKEFERP
jgi:hypothetical protein